MNQFDLSKKAFVFVVRRIYEFLFILFLRVKHVLIDGSICPGVNKYKNFVVNKKAIYMKKRKEGISGFYRVKNEEQLLEKSVLSHLPYLDEIIIVYNDCSDKTSEIARALARKYPDKIKVYDYKPKVFPALSYKHAVTCSKSPHSLANYYNFALLKTNYKVAVKIDADHIAVENKFKKICEDIRKKNIKTMFYFYGVNLFVCDNKLCVNKKQAFTHGYDCGFFPVVKGVYFIQRLKSESLHLPLSMIFTRKSLGVLFYHLKGVKKDKGLSFLRNSGENNFMKKERMRILDLNSNIDPVPFSEYENDMLNDVKRITYNELI